MDVQEKEIQWTLEKVPTGYKNQDSSFDNKEHLDQIMRLGIRHSEIALRVFLVLVLGSTF